MRVIAPAAQLPHTVRPQPGTCGRASGLRAGGMARFVVLHLLHDGARRGVVRRASAEVAFQVLLDLTLGLDHKTQADAVARAPRKQPDAEGAGVPQRVQQARARTQFVKACCVQARWSVSSRAAARTGCFSVGSRVVSACALYSACAQTSPTWFTRIRAPRQAPLVFLRVPAAARWRGARARGMAPARKGAQARCQRRSAAVHGRSARRRISVHCCGQHSAIAGAPRSHAAERRRLSPRDFRALRLVVLRQHNSLICRAILGNPRGPSGAIRQLPLRGFGLICPPGAIRSGPLIQPRRSLQ